MQHSPPNILLIMTDQQRWDSCGSASPAFMRTPHYDHLCREGIEFTSAYADCPICVPEPLTLTTWITEQCVDYIIERRDESVPFFLMCSYSKPHPPLDPPEPYYSMYRDCAIPDPVHGDWSSDDTCPEVFKRFRQQLSMDQISPEILREARAAYYGLITHIDYNLGRIFSALEDKGLFRDTLILYTSDHGEFLGDHFAGGKFFFHEPSAHVPFVLRLPQSWDDRRHGTQVDWLSLTDGHWKYIWYPEGPSEQLFNLKTDPQELHNLSGITEYDAKRRELYAVLRDRHAARNSDCIKNNELIRRPLSGDTERDRRNRSWPGYHSDRFPADIRH